MKAFSLILLLLISVGADSRLSSAQTPSQTSTATSAIPVDQANAHKAKDLIDQAIEALGGPAYLGIRDMQQSGRGYSFHHGRPASNGVLFWRFVQFPDRERVEITKERDIAQVYLANKGYEITYKGAHPMDEKDVTDYLRRRRFSLETVLRTWVNSPGVALFYEGNAIAAEHSALQVTLINSNNEAVTLYFDVDTHLPVKKTFTWRDPVDRQRNLEEEIYDNYRVVQGVKTPYDITRYFNGDMASQRFMNSVAYNQNPDPAMFDPHSGYNPNKQPSKR